jgi:hypothetical protein
MKPTNIALIASLALIATSAFAQPRSGPRSFNWQDFAIDAMQLATPGTRNSQNDPIVKRGIESQQLRGKCQSSNERNLADSRDFKNQMVTIGYNGQCNYAGAIAIALWQKTGPEEFVSSSFWSLSAGEVGIDDMGPTMGVSVEQWMVAVETKLEKAISVDPFPASKLPPWPQGKVIPALPLGLTWRGSADRELYESIRAGNYRVFCIFSSGFSCAAEVPERGTQMIPMISAFGLAEYYAVTRPVEGLAVLTGQTPSLTQQEFLSAKAKIKEREDRDLKRVLKDVERTIPKT